MSVISRYDRVYYQPPEAGLRAMARAAIKSWGLLLGLTLLGAAAGFVYTRTLTPLYQVDAALQSSGQRASVEHIRSPELLAQVVATVQPRLTVPELQAQLHVAEAGQGSGIFYLSLTSSDAAQARQILDTLGTLYVQHSGSGRLISAATANAGEPVGPPTEWLVAGAALLGALLALLIAWLRHTFDRRVESPHLLEKSGLAVFATLPWSHRNDRLHLQRKARGAVTESGLLSLAAGHDLAVESLRSLCTSLALTGHQTGNNTVMVTSPTATCGKSFVAGNLAVVLAQSGKRVLLVDADIREGNLHRSFNQPGPGLTDVLQGRKTPREVIQHTQVQGLDLMVRGLAATKPARLLTAERLSPLLQTLQPTYDLILIAAPAVLNSPIAGVIGHLAGTRLLVTRVGHTALRQVRRARRLLGKKAAATAAILNGLEREGGPEYDGAALGYDYSLGKS